MSCARSSTRSPRSDVMERAPVIAFRTTAGKGIGFGHLRRCLTLARELAARGAEPHFWIDLPGGDAQAIEVARADGFAARHVMGEEPAASLALVKQERPSALVADSYGLDGAWLRLLRRTTRALLVIDDLADREIDADLVENSACGAERLAYRTSDDCRMLLGPAYALLRPGFAAVGAARVVNEVAKRVLLTLGGADPEGRTATVARALVETATDLHLDVIIGPLYGDARDLAALHNESPSRVTLHHAPADLAPLMAAADLAVSAGGQTTFELAATGLPSVALSLADNQRILLDGFARAGTLVLAGDAGAPDAIARVVSEVRKLIDNRVQRLRMSLAGRALVDGRGAGRVAEALLATIAARASTLVEESA